ncbi:MAG: class I SAM-dependent rRNA methyltransferase [Chlorobi bacterium]|nr:MAG: class I SAM-dependent rRNA methyltransferase [Bacteroidota bacterium]MBE2266302.1 class I SAM-dependent rRNA methyltransferase [Flavobacteriales bacterium]MBL1161053.1 class I SAM-dependent rRNA methyltransferase [Chlorobiota bacterium]MBW7854290.1 class I SAM-dependent rRNA methyltransferase [Candidatus Kapabacteria bacterium]MCC6330996.1 class I SAM-dependent rRNA methyltransferase [Ignavibacteria bacterium]
MKIARLKPHKHKNLYGGYQWVFTTELAEPPQAAAGDIVTVISDAGREIGIGFYNPKSRIAVRIIGTCDDVVDTGFFVNRFRQALALRTRFVGSSQAYRLVFGESDMLSGLIIDIFSNVAVVQTFSYGMDIRLTEISNALRTVLPHLTAIVERNTMQVRIKEGLPLREGVLWGAVSGPVEFTENGIRLFANVLDGQKTGYFLDQKVNRHWVQQYSRGLSVLDTFCNVGGFALNAGLGGAVQVLGIDSSASAIESARLHAAANGLTTVNFEVGNVFDVLKDQALSGRTWDMVILDPPSFAKTRSALAGARSGYATLNRAALKLIPPNGYLVTSSCTQLVTEHDLLDIVYAEAARLNKSLRLIHRGNQAPDHPILLAMPETQYLKFLVFSVY